MSQSSFINYKMLDTFFYKNKLYKNVGFCYAKSLKRFKNIRIMLFVRKIRIFKNLRMEIKESFQKTLGCKNILNFFESQERLKASTFL